MEELLKEVALSERRKKFVDAFVEEMTDLLSSVPETPVVKVRIYSGDSESASRSLDHT